MTIELTAREIANEIIMENYGDLEGLRGAVAEGDVDGDGIRAMLERAVVLARGVEVSQTAHEIALAAGLSPAHFVDPGECPGCEDSENAPHWRMCPRWDNPENGAL